MKLKNSDQLETYESEKLTLRSETIFGNWKPF